MDVSPSAAVGRDHIILPKHAQQVYGQQVYGWGCLKPYAQNKRGSPPEESAQPFVDKKIHENATQQNTYEYNRKTRE